MLLYDCTLCVALSEARIIEISFTVCVAAVAILQIPGCYKLADFGTATMLEAQPWGQPHFIAWSPVHLGK